MGPRPWTSRRPFARRSSRLLPALLAAAAVAPAPALAAQDGEAGTGAAPLATVKAWASLGPIHAEEYIPLARLGQTPITEGPATLPAGLWEASLTLAFGNHFQLDSTATHSLVMDLERLVTAVDVRWGLTDALELAARMTFETTGGGVMDGFIEGLHGSLRLDNPTREDYPQDLYRQQLRDGTGATLVDIPARGFTLEDVRLRARYRVVGRSREGDAVTLRAGVRIPTADNTVGDEAPEASLSVLARVALGRVHLHAMAGAATVSGAPDVPRRRPAQIFGAGTVEVGLSRSVSALLQTGLGTSRLENFEGLEVDGPHVSLLAGLRGRHGGWGWQAAFQEDLPGWGSSADFTLVLGVSRRF